MIEKGMKRGNRPEGEEEDKRGGRGQKGRKRTKEEEEDKRGGRG
jgi:hypothetical protein